LLKVHNTIKAQPAFAGRQVEKQMTKGCGDVEGSIFYTNAARHIRIKNTVAITCRTNADWNTEVGGP
jgi:hypothetical protein